MRNIMKAKVCVPVILILIGLSCVAYATWSWAGATAWCASYDDGWGTASASVSWGGMVGGTWSTYAAMAAGDPDSKQGWVQGDGGDSSYLSGFAESGSAACNIGGAGADGVDYYDASSDSFTNADCNWCNGVGCSSCE